MKACVLEDIGKLVYQEIQKPTIKEDEVLLQIKACGICSSDIGRVFQTGTYHFPTIPGHEFAGQIVEVGEKVDQSLLGKRSVVFPLLPCQKCPSCMEKEYARCEHYNYFGSRCDGAFAQYLAVPVWNLALFSDTLDYSTAALCEPAAVALHGVHAAGSLAGKKVVVIGTGTIAFLTALWANELGAEQILMLGRSHAKQKFAEEFGIANLKYLYGDLDSQIQELTNGLGVSVVCECVGSEESVNLAVKVARKGGKVILYGNPASDITLPQQVYWKILRNELTIKGTWNSSYKEEMNDWKVTLSYMEQYQDKFAPLITHTFGLDQYKEAFAVLQNSKEFSIKVMFVM